VAYITGANPNVFYELGIRHALRPRSTVILFREGTVLPFDIVLVRGISYKADGAGQPVEAEGPIKLIAAQLMEARGNPHDDSPLFQLIDDLPRFEIDHTKTDVFRRSVDYSKRYKDRLATAVVVTSGSLTTWFEDDGGRRVVGIQLYGSAETTRGIQEVHVVFLMLRCAKKREATIVRLYRAIAAPFERMGVDV